MKIRAKGVSLAENGKKGRKKIGLGEGGGGEGDRGRSVEGLMVEGRAFTRGIS